MSDRPKTTPPFIFMILGVIFIAVGIGFIVVSSYQRSKISAIERAPVVTVADAVAGSAPAGAVKMFARIGTSRPIDLAGGDDKVVWGQFIISARVRTRKSDGSGTTTSSKTVYSKKALARDVYLEDGGARLPVSAAPLEGPATIEGTTTEGMATVLPGEVIQYGSLRAPYSGTGTIESMPRVTREVLSVGTPVFAFGAIGVEENQPAFIQTDDGHLLLIAKEEAEVISGLASSARTFLPIGIAVCAIGAVLVVMGIVKQVTKGGAPAA